MASLRRSLRITEDPSISVPATTAAQGRRIRDQASSTVQGPSTRAARRRSAPTAQDRSEEPLSALSSSASAQTPGRATRSRPTVGPPPPSARALGKRRAVSPEPAESAPESPRRPSKRLRAASSRSYNLRSRGSAPKAIADLGDRPAATMTKKGGRSKTRPLLHDDDDDLFAPVASSSHDADVDPAQLMDLDSADHDEGAEDEDEDDEDRVIIDDDDDDDEGGSEAEDMEESELEDALEPLPTTEIHPDGNRRKTSPLTTKERESRDAQEAADALAAAAAAAASEGDDHIYGSFAASLRAYPNLLAGMSSRFKELLAGLRNKVDPNVRFVSLTDLCEILAMSNEDTLSGPFRIDDFTKELVSILRGSDVAGDAAEANDLNFQEMVLACRCLANLMEALPGSTHNVVHSGAVPVLCAKLLEIQFIDLAEQTLITLEKISEEMPGHIVREGGLTAILTYLDFFATNVQRTAVTTAANCCRSLNPEFFGAVRDIMPTLRNVLAYADQRVVEQACLAITRIVESYRHQAEKLEALLNVELLQAICTLLIPGGGSVIGATTFTQLLRMLAIAARASPEVAMNLLEMNLVNTLYHLLVGVAAPLPGKEVEGVQHQREEDDMLVLTNLVHRPKDQVLEALSMITELLPSLPRDGVFGSRPASSKAAKMKIKREDQSPALEAPIPSTSAATSNPENPSSSPLREQIKNESSPGVTEVGGAPMIGSARAAAMFRERESQSKKRMELLKSASPERNAALKRFHLLMLPTLVEVYAASVGVQVRTKALLGMSKIIQFCAEEDLQMALKGVPLASFLANLLATRDQHLLVASGLQMVELLLTKLPDLFQFVFRREGVYHEVERLAAVELSTGQSPHQNITKPATKSAETHQEAVGQEDDSGETLGTKADVILAAAASGSLSNLTRAMRNMESMSDGIGPSGGILSTTSVVPTEQLAKDQVTQRARYVRDKVFTSNSAPARKAQAELDSICQLVCFFDEATDTEEIEKALLDIAELFMRSESPMTSFELLESRLLERLLRFLSQGGPGQSASDLTFQYNVHGAAPVSIYEQQHLFFSVFSPTSAVGPTPLSNLVKRLQDALSRIETFDVVTAFQSSSDEARRNAASLLGRQLRVTLKAEGSEFPARIRTIPVQVHAIATYQALHEYLKPRLMAALIERPQESTSAPSLGSARERLNGALAALQEAHSTLEAIRLSRQPRLSSSVDGLGTGIVPGSPSDGNSSGLARRERRRSSRLSAKHATADTSSNPDRDRQDVEIADEDENGEMDAERLLDEGIFEGEFDAPVAEDDKPINVKVAADGHKMEAATPDGTRVATPVQKQSGFTGPSGPTRPLTLPGARPSYASVAKSDASDWHLEFSIGGQDIALDTTIYSSIHRYEAAQGNQLSARSMWTNAYPVTFRKVAGPVAAIVQNTTPEPASRDDGALLAVPDSIDPNSKQGHILQLLRVLHKLNADVPTEMSSPGSHAAFALPEVAFVNNKLTAKLSRQLEEPMIVASSCLPDWSLDLPQFYAFLFPFATRHSFLQSTSFGYARLLARWANTSRPDAAANRRDEGLGYLGRLTRQKVRISRQRMLESAVKVFELYAGGRASLEVEYFDEVGTGLGPTLEFYASVSREFQRKDLKLWRQGDNDSTRSSTFIYNALGLFPAPLDDSDLTSESARKTLGLFRTLGQFVAQGLMDSRILDLPFNRHFMKLVLDPEGVAPSMAALAAVDPALAKSLSQMQTYADSRASIVSNRHLSTKGKESKLSNLTVNGSSVEDLSLDFVLPGYPTIELKEDGQKIAVEGETVAEYVRLVVDYTLSRGIKAQLRAFREGFSTVFPVRDMRTFTPEELVLLFGNSEEDWSAPTLRDTIRADHGLSLDSRALRFLIEIMSSYNAEERRQFLQFITGSPKLPVGGFAALSPPLTVVRRGGANEHADSQLPSVMTCASYLKLPDYSSIEVMRERLSLAIREGANSFHLS